MLRIHPPLPQLRAHDPCGHWHKGGGDTSRSEERFAANCWEPTIATDGTKVLYVITGRHRPNELYMLRHDIATNYWDTPLFRKDILHSNWDGGASIAGETLAFHCYGYNIAGEQFNEVTSNPRMVTYVNSVDGDHVKEWPGTTEIHGRNRVAVTSAGVVACIIRTSTSWQTHVSINHGASYVLLGTLPGTPVIDIAVVISPNDNLIYVATINASPDILSIYTGTNTGTGWALKSTTPIVSGPKSLRFAVDGSRFFATVQGSSSARFYYSTNNCASFTASDLHEPSVHFAATETLLYNLADQIDYRTTNYEDAVIDWASIAQFETLVDRCTLHNSGAMTVYSQAKLRVESSEGNIVAILISRNLGERWQEIQTPLHYYETFEETLNLNDPPFWPFVPQYAKL